MRSRSRRKPISDANEKFADCESSYSASVRDIRKSAILVIRFRTSGFD